MGSILKGIAKGSDKNRDANDFYESDDSNNPASRLVKHIRVAKDYLGKNPEPKEPEEKDSKEQTNESYWGGPSPAQLRFNRALERERKKSQPESERAKKELDRIMGPRPVQSKDKPEDKEITEAFDQPYPYEWDKDDFGDYHALAFLDDGSPLELSFSHEGSGQWHVTFDRNFKFDVTGEGDQQRVFATVLAAVKEFVQERQPQKIIFSATKSVKPGQKITSRAGLYNSLVNRYAAALGYTSNIDDRGDQVVYELMRVQKPVAEGLAQDVPPVLYHATYKPRLKSIKLKGLGAGGKRNWEDSQRGVVYLALDPNVAESYAETSDMVPEEWLDSIVILKISTTGLDSTKFQIDSNVQDNEGDTVEYHGVIPPSNISLYKQGVAEGELNFEEGDCPIFAIALHRLSKMPLMALVEYDDQMGSTVLIHAYVKLDDRWRLDASGETDVDWMLQRYPNNGHAEEIEISEKDLLELGYGKSKCPTLQQVLPHAKEVLQNIEEVQQGLAEGCNKISEDLSNYNGLNIDYEFSPDELTLYVSAISGDGETKLGSVEFEFNGEAWVANELVVDEHYRKQGIASTMYDFVKKHLGKKIIPSHSQTDAGRAFWKNKQVWEDEQGVAEGATVTRIDSKPITDFATGLKSYKHTGDWSQSGLDTGDDSYWKNKNLKTKTTKGLFAGDPRRTALYATGNAHETRYVEFTQNGQPIVYFDKKDLPAIRSRKTYLTVFDAGQFKKLPTGEWFSKNPGKPIEQTPIGDPFKYIASQGWVVRVTDDLDKVFKQVQQMHKAGKIAHYGAEGMNESQQGVAEGKVKLYTDPSYFGAEVDDTGLDNLPIVNISANQLVGFEPDAKMNQPKSRANVEKIVAGLKQGAKLPPLLVRKYKNGYQVLDGHHRFWAYKLLGVKSIPSRIVPDEDIEEISKQGVAEAITPSQKLRSSVLYHGTDTKAAYQGIASQGLKYDPKLIAQKYKGQENFAPLPGGIYLTTDFGNAVRYSFMSNVPDEQWAEYIKQEPYGYVFEFFGKDLTGVTTDEDELGNLLQKLVNTKNLQPNLLKIVQLVPKELKVKLQQPNVDYEINALAGKWLVNNISDVTMQYLVKRYHNVVNYSGMKPNAVWIIPKPNERFLRDRQGTFNTFNGFANYAKKFGKRYDLTNEKQGVAEGTNVDVGGIQLNVAIDGAEVSIRPIVDGYQAGYVVFDRDGRTLVPDDLAIDDEFRGRGIAKIIYDYVKSLGFTIRRSSVQTRAGKHFWDKNRGEDGMIWEEELDEACWKGYHKKGMKTMFGKRYPNCVKNTNEDRQQCPECGGPMFSEEMINEKKDACYYKVKSRYKVWPSAYASGALVQCRKKGASNWGTKSESSILEGIEQTDEDLHKWFKEKWVRFGPDGKIRGACARGDDSEGKPKCLPQSKAQNLGKKGRASAASRKRREDPNPERSGKAINVATKKKTTESSILQGISETKGLPMPGSYEQEYGPFKKKGGYRIMTLTSEQEELDEKWSDKYKRSIDCNHPKGFSQRAHCQGRKKK